MPLAGRASYSQPSPQFGALKMRSRRAKRRGDGARRSSQRARRVTLDIQACTCDKQCQAASSSAERNDSCRGRASPGAANRSSTAARRHHFIARRDKGRTHRRGVPAAYPQPLHNSVPHRTTVRRAGRGRGFRAAAEIYHHRVACRSCGVRHSGFRVEQLLWIERHLDFAHQPEQVFAHLLRHIFGAGNANTVLS